MTDPLYQKPTTDPVTPLFGASDGLPLPPVVTNFPQYTVPNGYPNIPEVKVPKQTKELWFNSNGVPATAAEIEGRRFNEVRRNFYELYRIWAYYLWLNTGYKEWAPYPLQPNADWYAAEPLSHPTTQYGKRWGPIAATNGPGPKQITLTWQESDDVNPRHLTRESDGVIPSSIGVSDMLIDDETGDFGRALIEDSTLQPVDGLNHSTILDLDKPLQAGRSGEMWIVRENRPPTFPAISLKYDAPVCKHAIQSKGNFFSSSKAVYPDAYTSGFIADTEPNTWWCDNMNNPLADPDCFSAACENTACPAYEVHTPFYPTDNTIFLSGRGFYFRQISFLSQPPELQYLYGREQYDGLYLMLGLPVGYLAGLHHLKAKLFVNWGKVLYDTGGTTDQGYSEFLSFDEQQENRRANSELETDAGTILEELQGNSRYDPAGGADSSDRLLVENAARTPGFIAASGGHRRKSGGPILKYGETEVGLSYGDNSVFAANLNSIQRVRPPKRTSLNFSTQIPGVTRGYKTEVTVLATPETVPGLANIFDVSFQIPRYADRIDNSVQEKAIKPVRGVTNDSEDPLFNTAAKIHSSSIGSGVCVIELELFDQTLTTYPNPSPGFDDVPSAFNSGGYVVAPDIAHRLTNPGSGDGVDFPGDPESKWIFPGDAISFSGDDAQDVLGVEVHVVAAEAFAGSVDGAATAPNALLDGIPDYVRANYNKRDRITISLEGSSGAVIQAWIESFGANGLLGQDVYIGFGGVRISAVAPPVTYYDGTTGRGYEPTITATPKATGTPAVIDPADYVWDSMTGIVYLDSSNLTPGEYVLQFSGWVYDARKLYPCEDGPALRDMILKVCEKCFVQLTPPMSVPIYGQFTEYDDGTTTDPFDLIGYNSGDAPFEDTTVLEDDVVPIFGPIVRTWIEEIASSPPYRVGLSVGDNLGEFFSVGGGFAAVLIPFLFNASRFPAAAVSEARLEISFENPIATNEWIEVISFEPPPGGQTQEKDEVSGVIPMEISLTVFSKVAGTGFDLQDPGPTIPVNFSPINISGTDYLRGTADMTSALKFMLSHQSGLTTDVVPVPVEFVLVITGVAPLPTGTATSTDLAKTYIDENVLHDPQQIGDRASCWNIQYTGVEVGEMYIKTDGAELTNGAQLPYDSNGLFSDRPDMTYEPPGE